MFRKIVYTAYILSLLLFSCKPEKCIQDEIFRKKVGVVLENCSFDERKTVNIINGLEGIIIDKSSSYVIETKNGTKYYACNLPDSVKKVGLKVYFCGEKKKEKPNEKVVANLLKITDLYIE